VRQQCRHVGTLQQHGVVVGLAHAGYRFATSETLLPPKAKELDMMACTSQP
jgi:biotin operon repressor